LVRKLITLDLRREGKLDKKHMTRMQDIMKRNVSVFIDFIESLSEPYVDNLDWWVASPASRNIMASGLYYDLCCIQFFKEVIEIEDVENIYTDSREFKKVLESITAKNKKKINIICSEKYIASIISALVFTTLKRFSGKLSGKGLNK